MRKMKNSGVAWIGDIPENWKVLRNKNLIYEINEKCTDTTDLPLLSVSEYYGVAPRADKIHDGQIVSRAETFEGYKICHQDDVVMNIMLAWKRAQAVSSFNGIVSPAYCVYRKKNNSKLDMTFFNYLIRSDLYISVFKRFSTGIIDSRLRLYPEKFLALHSHVPPTYEQHKIAKHLNKACNNIENLINNQEQQMEKLKQYKQSLITEVVTKGLNPNVSMKDSGVEWIGKIPKEWKLSKVSMFYDVTLGKMLQPEKQEETDTLENYLCAANLGNNTLKLNVLKQMWFSQKDKAQYNVKKGDLIVVEGGDVASCDIVRSDVSNLYFQNALHRVRAKKGFSLDFLRYNLIMAKSQGYISLICNKATIAHFTKDKLMTLPMLYIPLPEQQQIATYLDNKCAKIDRLIAIKQEKINKLNDYKKSLIYEYVTGKREVC